MSRLYYVTSREAGHSLAFHRSGPFHDRATAERMAVALAARPDCGLPISVVCEGTVEAPVDDSAPASDDMAPEDDLILAEGHATIDSDNEDSDLFAD